MDSMNMLIVFVVAVLILQVAMFFMIRAKKKKERENSVVEKYKIKSAGEAFKLMNDNAIPEEDRIKIEQLYNGDETSWIFKTTHPYQA